METHESGATVPINCWLSFKVAAQLLSWKRTWKDPGGAFRANPALDKKSRARMRSA